MTDLTAITTPFGLLDRETQEALKAHGGPWEFFDNSGSWDELDAPAWQKNFTYRVKSAPPKPREFWIVNECEAYGSRAEAGEALIGLMPPHRIIHVREVLPD